MSVSALSTVQAMAGSRTDCSDEYSLETMHSLERYMPYLHAR